ncbi:family 43 glycosylhydrolase, partial [Laedolimicola sp.]|uniref:family 43 glycosylhydrolase n=1 Tax=Laedolimicola sp. TaxID=2981663 RepID=UPI003F803F0F
YTGAGNALYLDGSAKNYLTVTDKEGKSLLTGVRELSVSFDMKPDRTATNWPFYAAPNGSAQTYLNERYIGIMQGSGKVTVQRYNNGGSRPTSASADAGDGWVHVDAVLDGSTTKLYLNGELQSEAASSVRLSSILGDSSILQIGKANWGSGEYYKGWLDNLTIRNYAMTQEEVTAEAATLANSISAVKSVLVGTAPDRETALTYRGTDNHTAVYTKVDEKKKEITSYLRQSAELTKVPVTFTFQSEGVTLTADGAAFENGGELDLTKDVTIAVKNAAGKEETWTVKKAIAANNPVLPGQYADPDIDYMDGKFWIFPTTDGYPGWSGTVFHAFSSADLVNWTDEGVILDVANDNPGLNEKGVQIAASPWSVGSAWAPTIEAKNGKYYFYYCAKFSNGQSAIGVAVADNPAGPYTDKGEALMTVAMCNAAGVKMGQAIDPSIFTDDDGTSYIFFGNGSAAMAELNDDMMSIKEGTIRQITGLKDFRESVVVTKIKDTYHWTWSCDDANSPNYHVNYGVSDSLTGSITYKGTLLSKDESQGILGSAHQSVVKATDADGKDRYFMAYHRFYTPLDIFTSGDGLGKHRETCVDEITFDTEGYMQIAPTLEGVSFEPKKDDDTEIAELLAAFDFNDVTAAGFEGGNAKATGSYSQKESYEGAGKALYLDGSSTNFLTVTDKAGKSLLTGVEELTVSFELKPDRTNTNWAFYAAPNENKQTAGQEKYLGILQNNGTLTAERYKNSGSRPANASVKTGSNWRHVDVVVSKTATVIYVDGVKQSEVKSTYNLRDILGSNSVLYIGKANWGSGEYYKGWLDNLQIYSKALTEEELQAKVSDAYKNYAADRIKKQIQNVVIEESRCNLETYDNMVTWKSTDPKIQIEGNGYTAVSELPAAGSQDYETTLTAVISVCGKTYEKAVNATIKAEVAADASYGYLMVHFVENSKGYAEKIYLDISRGDNPEQWDPLNGREPILASNLGTTGVRDPFLTYNPETETYYIIATDLRVFGADNAGWGVWQRNYSTKMNVWESKDLIHWSDVRQFDVALNTEGVKQANMGMMWAPEATWVEDYYGEGKGAFIVYWSTRLYGNADQSDNPQPASDIAYGVTTDFTQETYSYGGKMLEGGSSGWIDTTILQDGNKTYHITKSNAEQIIMEVTEAKEWWNYETTEWTRVQSRIGVSRYGAVEGPAVFKDHSTENRWYLFVDDMPSPGYQPMISTNLSKGWEYLDSSDYYLTEYTKHGGVISLTKAQYDAIRNADAVSAVKETLDSVEVAQGADETALKAALPETAEVNLAYDKGTSKLPVIWDLSGVKTGEIGEYEITGVVQSIGANDNQWKAADGSGNYLADGKTLYSSTAVTVKLTVKVVEKTEQPEKPEKPENPEKPDAGESKDNNDKNTGSNQNTGSGSHHKSGSGSAGASKTTQTKAAKTADMAQTELWLLLAMASGLGILPVLKKRIRKSEKE